MKRFILALVVLLSLTAVVAYSASSKKNYQPTERIPADTAVSFPVDI
jgi:hypothetical protein